MKGTPRAHLGISASPILDDETLNAVDYVEIKTITVREAKRYGRLASKPLLFHIQYSKKGRFYEPAVSEFGARDLARIASACSLSKPRFASIHFGLSAPKISVDERSCIAVAGAKPLDREVLLRTMEKNLRALKRALPLARVLFENCEFIPEALCAGAYRHVSEAGLIRESAVRWAEEGILDGILFDIAHALIAAANHPLYDGTSSGPPTSGGGLVSETGRGIDKTGVLDRFRLYLEQMPVSLIRELHISGIRLLPDGVYVDAHDRIGELELAALKTVLAVLREADLDEVYLTLEYAKDAAEAAAQLAVLRDALRGHFERPST